MPELQPKGVALVVITRDEANQRGRAKVVAMFHPVRRTISAIKTNICPVAVDTTPTIPPLSIDNNHRLVMSMVWLVKMATIILRCKIRFLTKASRRESQNRNQVSVY